MSRLTTLFALVTALVFCTSVRADRNATTECQRPNIVYILADDLGYGDPGCYNSDSKVPTPCMDRLAAEGMRFTDAHSNSAVCTPTRYGVLTGRYCWRTRLKRSVLMGESPSLIAPDRTTVASFLKQYGYRTICIGKWHLGLDWAKDKDGNIDYTKQIKNGPTALGFDYYYGIPASLDMTPYVYVENDRVVTIPNQTIEKAGGLGRFRGGPIASDFKHIDVLPTLTQKAIECLDDCARTADEKPFFLYFPLSAPHTPILPTEQFIGKSKAGVYGDFVAQVDWTIGQVLKTLDRHGLVDNTLIIVTSDNGSTMKPMTEYNHLPNDHLRGRKSDVWDGGHRVPFIVRWPKTIKPNTTCNETTSLTDLLATCADIMGVDKLPSNVGEDSYSILPALKGQKLVRTADMATVHHSIEGMFAIRQGPWKLIIGQGSGGWSSRGKKTDPPIQLYNMETDRAETTNVYQQHPDVVKRLTALLDTYKASGRSRP